MKALTTEVLYLQLVAQRSNNESQCEDTNQICDAFVARRATAAKVCEQAVNSYSKKKKDIVCFRS